MNYPKTFSSCPVCGSIERFGEMATQEEISKGNLSIDSKTAIMISRTMLFNPKDSGGVILFRKEVPVLVGFYDVCCNCGCLYCVEMQKGVGVVEPQAGPKSGQDIPPFFAG